MAGYVVSILERDLHWETKSYLLEIDHGVVTITLFRDDPVRREDAEKQLRTIDGLKGLAIVVKPSTVPSFPEGESSERPLRWERFPAGDLFRPLLADPKQAQFFVGVNRFSSSGARYTMASVGFGETFGLSRLNGHQEGNGLQFGIEGGIFARFNLSSASNDLVNADYTIGIPVTWRYGGNSIRSRLYHQSSHLGDELLLGGNPPERVNLSYESVELIYSREWLGWRLYAGGEYLIHKEPADLEPLSAHWGLEYRGAGVLLWKGRPIGGVDMKCLEEHDWAVDVSIKAGLEFGHPDPGNRRLRLMGVWYKGFDPRGQFYSNEVEIYGLELSLGF